MTRLNIFAFGLLTVAGACASAEEQKRDQSGLSMAIFAGKDKSGSPVIERAGKFEVSFTNRSDMPIRLWDESCQHGHGTLTLRVVDDSGQSWSMHRREWEASVWKKYPTKTTTILPGGVFSWRVSPSEYGGGWGKWGWLGVPEANTGKAFKLTAIFEIKSSDAAKGHGVWTGRIESKPLDLLVVDAKLKTPHDYLAANCPRQAIKMIQADRKWLTQEDDMQQTPLHVAALCGLTDAVKWLLENGADVNARAYNSFTPLHLASDPETVKLLLKHKADGNAKNVSGRTALEEAAGMWAQYGTLQDPERDRLHRIIKLLLDAGAKYDICSAACLDDVDRVRALILADKKQARDKEAMLQAGTYGREQIVKLLLEHGADPEAAVFVGLPASYFAIEHANVLRLLFGAGADPKVTLRSDHWRGPQGSTLLHEAARKGALESAKLLLDRGVKVDGQEPLDLTPLHYACTYGHAAVAELLIQNKADPKRLSQEGWTPLWLATSKIHPGEEDANMPYKAVIRVLERAGVELDIFAAIACNDLARVADILKASPKAGEKKDPEGATAFHWVVMFDHREIVKILLEKGGDPNVRSDREADKSSTALIDAAWWGRPEISEMLIKHGAKIDARDAKGGTPLHHAALMKQLAVARLLIKHGADVNAKDNEGKTPLDWSRTYAESPEMTKLLKDHGAGAKP